MKPPAVPPSAPLRPGVHRFRENQAWRLLGIQFVRMFLPCAFGIALALIQLCLSGEVESRPNLFPVLIAVVVILVAICGLFAWLPWRKRIRPLWGSTACVEKNGLVVRRSDGSALFVAPPDRVFVVGRKKGRVTSIRTVAQGGTDLVLDAFEDLDGLLREIGEMFEKNDIADLDENAEDDGSFQNRPQHGYPYREELASGAKRRLTRRFLPVIAVFALYLGLVWSVESSRNEPDLVVPIVATVLVFAIMFVICLKVRTKILRTVRGTTATVHGKTLWLTREGHNPDMLSLPGLHLREFRTRGILDELWLCKNKVIVLRLFGFEDLENLRIEIKTALEDDASSAMGRHVVEQSRHSIPEGPSARLRAVTLEP